MSDPIQINLHKECEHSVASGSPCRDVVFWANWLKVDSPIALYGITPGLSPTAHYNATARNRTRHAARAGYYCRVIPWSEYNDHLEDIWKINLSAPQRQGRPMSEGYTVKPTPQTAPTHECRLHNSRWHGVFAPDGKLVGYINGNRCGDLAAASQILGHADHLHAGCMLLLWAHWVQWCADQGVGHILYSRWSDGTDGLRHWKHSVGMRPTVVGS